jgi:putative addiction module component (TIGR02574 family)
MQLIDIEALGPAERMELADVLYDSAMEEIEQPSLTPEQVIEIDRRLSRLHSGQATLISWDEAYQRLMHGR